MRFLPLILLSIAFFVWTASPAQNTYVFDPKYPVHSLDDYLLVIKDADKNLTIEDLIDNEGLVFSPLEQFEQSLDRTAAYWAKLNITSEEDIYDWLLFFEHRYYLSGGWGRGNGKVDVYGIRDEQITWHKKTGANYPTKEKDIKPRWNINRVSLDLSKGDTLSLFARVEGSSFGSRPVFNMTIRSPEYQHHQPLFNQFTFFNKFVFGILFITFVYHFLLFLYLRQRVYLWFSVWLFIGIITAATNIDVGLINEFFLGNFPQLSAPMWMLSSNCVWFSFWFFGRSFVGTKKKFPILDKVIVGLTIIIAAEMIVNLFILIFNPTQFYISNAPFHFSVLSLFTLFGLVISVVLSFKKDLLARYFGIGAIFATMAPMVGGLWAQGIIDLPIDPFVWGIFLQIIAYSFGLAYRQQVKDRAFKKAQLDLFEAERSNLEMQRIKDLDEIKTRFFANISHEFRTPLTLISGSIQQILKKEKGARSDEIVSIPTRTLDLLQRNARRLQSLVDQLLDLSKLKNGQVQLELKNGGLIKFIRSIVFSFESMGEKKKIQFSASFPEEIPAAYYDADKLEKILTNLLSNAFKYTRNNGAVWVHVSNADDHLIIEVSDTGKGMDKEAIQKIFERFYRVEGTEEVGSGIGLALTKELVEVYAGQISVDSTVGKGTTFKIRLPYRMKDLPTGVRVKEEGLSGGPNSIESANVAGLPETQDPGLANGKEKTSERLPLALIVEDNADLRNYIAEIIQQDYRYVQASDGLQGEKMAQEHIPDIIISDVMMPGKNGYELCQSLKSNSKTSHIPIIILTAKAGQASKLEGLEQGADAYLTKPFDQEELLLRLRNLVAARKTIWEQFKSLDITTLEHLDLQSIDDQFIREVYRNIEENVENELYSVEELARAVNFSRSQLHRKLKAILNKSANQLIKEIRLERARQMLIKKTGTVSEIAFSVGYANLSYFSKSYKEHFGRLPSEEIQDHSAPNLK